MISTNLENNSPKKLIKEIDLEEVNRELSSRIFKEFITYTFAKYEWSWHLEELAGLLEKFIKGELPQYDVLLLDFPPRHGKSEQVSVRLPPFFLGIKPDKEIIVASYSGELASEFGSKARDVMRSNEYQNVFNDIMLSEDTKAKNRWNTNKGGSYTATGIGGSITGKGADLFVVDDPFKDRKEAESKLARDTVWSFYQSVAQTRMSPGGKKIVIQTRWHDDDLIGRIKKLEKEDPNSDRVLHISFPAIATKNEKFRKIGEALWPTRFSLGDLIKKKANIGSREFSALYQGNPVDDQSAYFKRKDFRYIAEEDVEKKRTMRFLTVDSAITKKEDNCPTGFVDNRVDVENFWNIKAWRKWMSPKELMDELFILQELNQYDEIGVEETLFTMALQEFYEIEQRRRNKFLPITYIKTNGRSKDIRARGVAPRYESHSVRHIGETCGDLEDEMVRWPSGEFRDLVDALAHQKDFAYKPDSDKQKEEEDKSDRIVKDGNDIFNTGIGESDDGSFGINY